MTKRRLSQAISEGDGISIIVGVDSADAARDAEAAGAEGVLVSAAENLASVRGATELPILVVHDRSGRHRRRRTRASSTSTARIGSGWNGYVSTSPSTGSWPRGSARRSTSSSSSRSSIPRCSCLHADGDEPLDDALELLQDVPAGTAIADVGASTRDQVAALERAGMDAVIVYAGNIADLVGSAPPEV